MDGVCHLSFFTSSCHDPKVFNTLVIISKMIVRIKWKADFFHYLKLYYFRVVALFLIMFFVLNVIDMLL